MIELIALTLLLGTCTFIYLHLMGWLWKYRELGNQLVVQTEMTKHLSEEKQNEARKVRQMIEEMKAEIEAIQTDMNGINLKLGLKLK
jgi:type VI protein secretion system component VasK